MGAVRIYHPGPPLDDFVACFWSWSGDKQPAAYERSLPSGTLELVVNLEDDRLHLYGADGPATAAPVLPGAIVCGAHAGSFVIGAPPRRAIGVHFQPGGAAPFLGVPASDLQGRHAPIEALWGTQGRTLRERLLEQPTGAAQFDVLSAFLIERTRPRARRDAAVRAALCAFEDPSLASVAEVNARVGRSAKRLISVFGDEVGLTPKAYWRVRRFQAALRALPRSAGRGAALAAELGYFDQAHLDREFRHFAGVSPRDYLVLARNIERPHHLPLHGQKYPSAAGRDAAS